MTPAEYFTLQFYTWEYRGRGYYVSDFPVHLEPPFIPFYRHGYIQASVDESRRPTLVSSLLESFKRKKQQVQTEEILDYETIEPFPFDTLPELTAIHITIPKERKQNPDTMKAFLLMLSYTQYPVSFEIIGTSTSLVIQIVASSTDILHIHTQLQAYYPNYFIQRNDTYITEILKDDLPIAIADFGLEEEFIRPINIPKNFSIDPLTGIYGIIDALKEGEQAGIQVLFTGTVNSWTNSILASVTNGDGKSFFQDAPEFPKLAQEKIQSRLFAVTIRAFAQSNHIHEAITLAGQVSTAIMNASKGLCNQLAPLIYPEGFPFKKRISDIYLRESHRLGMLLNADELLSIVHFPGENVQSQKLSGANKKTVATPLNAKNKAFVLGYNRHNNQVERVGVSIEDRLKHTHIIGATGTGKSTLIANLILQDIQKGLGLTLFDPHGDLTDDIIARIPEERLHDVILIDPSDTDYPIGLNILEAHSEQEKEILSSDLVAAFRKYSTSWGDQMNSVFGNAVLAMLESSEKGTLNDLRRFLLEPTYRNNYLQTVKDPSIAYYWHKEYPQLKTSSIGPILTRLDTFLRPKTIRNMVVQKTGIDFEEVISKNKILLLKLTQGLIGTENSYLLGSLLLSKIHQAILARQNKQHRSPFFIYIDEFQNFITPSIKEMVSGIRKYQSGLILSHQDMMQVSKDDGELLNALLNNVHTRIAFRVGESDAQKLKTGFTHFEPEDLQNLGRGEAIIRIEQPKYDCSIDTMPLTESDKKISTLHYQRIQEQTREQYGRPKEEVEKELFASLAFSNDEGEAPTVKNKPNIPQPKKAKENQESIQHEKESHIPEPSKPSKKEKVHAPEAQSTKDVSAHRYLQNLVKKMAESKGYIATIEKSIESGSIDVELIKDGKRTAIEICNTTDAEWEVHNIKKCISAHYDVVISLSGDKKQLDKIQKKWKETETKLENQQVLFFTPDVLFQYLDETVTETQVPQEQTIKGYLVKVKYDSISQEEMMRKRKTVAEVVLNSLRKKLRNENCNF